MTGATLRRVTVWLCIALSFTTLLVVLGRNANEVMPTITSSKPSGTRLAADVLESNGFKVRQDLNQSPQIAADETIVAFVITSSGEPKWPGDAWGGTSQIRAKLTEQVVAGRKMIVVLLRDDFNQGTKTASLSTYQQVYSKTKPFKVHAGPNPMAYAIDNSKGTEPITVWMNEAGTSTLVSYESMGDGVVAHVHDGVAFTNRFIDQADNAAFFATLVSSVAGKSKKIVFTEASFGNVSDSGMISALGGWARATVWQGYLLFGVIAWTSALTFGLPMIRRRRQAGVRDLMEAFAKMLARSKNPRMAQDLMISALRRDLLKMAALPAKATDSQMEARLPREMMEDLVAARGEPSHPATLAAISRLRSAIGDHRRTK